jgi:hypothetical protein
MQNSPSVFVIVIVGATIPTFRKCCKIQVQLYCLEALRKVWAALKGKRRRRRSCEIF